jgi:hypothetical protein
LSAGILGHYLRYLGCFFLFSRYRVSDSLLLKQLLRTKYLTLIKLHRDNVAEIEIKGMAGRKVFVQLLQELREIIVIVRGAVERSGQSLTQRDVLQIAYYCLFYGVGRNSSRMLESSLGAFDRSLIVGIIKH